MSITVSIHEAQLKLPTLLEKVMNGEEVVIAKSGKPIARLSPYSGKASKPRRPGNDEGKVFIAPDFDEPLLEFEDL